jgi:hypothetical protein
MPLGLPALTVNPLIAMNAAAPAEIPGSTASPVPMWVYRLGFERAKRYLLTGDEILAPKAAEIGLILECVPDHELLDHAAALARRMAQLPGSQLEMIKLLCNQTAESMGLASAGTRGTFLGGVARHTEEGRDFVETARRVGLRQAVRERDVQFGGYGSRQRQSGWTQGGRWCGPVALSRSEYGQSSPASSGKNVARPGKNRGPARGERAHDRYPAGSVRTFGPCPASLWLYTDAARGVVLDP